MSRTVFGVLVALSLLGCASSKVASESTLFTIRPYAKVSLPRADEVVSTSYSSGRFKVELDGVCSLDGGEVNCWNAAGATYEDLERRVRGSISAMGQAVSTLVSKLPADSKNRLIVTKWTETWDKPPVGPHPPTDFLQVMAIGSTDSEGVGMLHVEPPAPTRPSEFVSYQARMVSEGPSLKEIKIRLLETRNSIEFHDIPCKVGAHVKFGGHDYLIDSFEKGSTRETSFSGQGKRAVWTLKLKWEGGKVLPVNSYSLVGDKGELFVLSDEKGQPFSQEESARKGLDGVIGNTHTSGNGWIYVTVFADPTKVAKLRIHTRVEKNVDLTGIPMDPRG